MIADIRNFDIEKCKLETKPEKINVDLYRQVEQVDTSYNPTFSGLKYYSYP
jgi:hypothetical protein